MKFKLLILIIFCTLLIGCGEKEYRKHNDYTIKAISYNVCCKNSQYGNTVLQRVPVLNKILNKYNPDIIGFQEYDLNWQTHLSPALTHKYGVIFKSRSRNDTECTPIFYKKDRFELLNQGYFWLSETPEKQSKSWGAKNFRICSWGKFKIKSTDTIFFFFNTHFDFNEQFQTKSAELIKSKIQNICGNYPLILSGDFNMTHMSKGYSEITSFLTDVNIKKDQTPTYRTFDNTFSLPIDFIFTNDKIIPVNYQVITDSENGKFPSDHFGIYTELIIN